MSGERNGRREGTDGRRDGWGVKDADLTCKPGTTIDAIARKWMILAIIIIILLEQEHTHQRRGKVANDSKYNNPANRPTRIYSPNATRTTRWTAMYVHWGLYGYDLLAFFLERPFRMPPRRIERVLDLDFGLASWDEEAVIGVPVAGGFLFLR